MVQWGPSGLQMARKVSAFSRFITTIWSPICVCTSCLRNRISSSPLLQPPAPNYFLLPTTPLYWQLRCDQFFPAYPALIDLFSRLSPFLISSLHSSQASCPSVLFSAENKILFRMWSLLFGTWDTFHQGMILWYVFF